MLALDRPADLTYVEGYGWNGGIPLRHAWCVDTAGYAIDPTWGYHSDFKYWGIPLRLEYVRKIVSESREWGGVVDQTRMTYDGMAFCAPLMAATPEEFRAPRWRHE